MLCAPPIDVAELVVTALVVPLLVEPLMLVESIPGVNPGVVPMLVGPLLVVTPLLASLTGCEVVVASVAADVHPFQGLSSDVVSVYFRE